MNKPISIAIDGPVGAGKSSIAGEVANRLGLMHLDTGAMYRAVGYFMLQKGVSLEDPAAIAAHLPEADVDVVFTHGEQHVLVNGEDVTGHLRENEMSMAASRVSAVPEVRTYLVAAQRRIASDRGVVMDGRDIGTAVLPDADLKIYLTADAKERARRRVEQMRAEKGEALPFEQVLSELLARDEADSHRAVSPLRQAEDAVVVDSTHLTIGETVETILRLAQARQEANRP